MPFTVGDGVGDFTLASGDGKPVTLSDTVGVPVVLLFLPTNDESETTLARGFAALHQEFVTLRTPVLAIRRRAVGLGVRTPGDVVPSPGEFPFPQLLDSDAKLTSDYAAHRLRTVLLDMNARVWRIYEPVDPAGHAADVLADVKALLHREEPRQVIQQAPVLLVPKVFPPEFCRELVQIWETEGNQDSGFMRQENGQTVGKIDYGRKRRRDHFIPAGNDLHKRIGDYLGRRITREIVKAFNYPATRLEQIKIACYEAVGGGYFRPHRDNTTEATAHRRFACSLLLNDDYEGGYLRFPEYGPHLYRPDAGSAVIFSCTLLHEATDVTAGRRFVLLTFFYGDKEARIREEYNKRVGGTYRA